MQNLMNVRLLYLFTFILCVIVALRIFSSRGNNEQIMANYYRGETQNKTVLNPGCGTPCVKNTTKAENKVRSQYPESKLAHRLLDGLFGIEIGASTHNQFGLNALNVDYTDDPNALFQKHQVQISGKAAKVHIVAPGDKLPFTNESVDFVLSSHVLEHFYDPIKTIKEWLRVVKPGGYVYMDIPHKERTFDKPRKRTTLNELIERHRKPDAEQAKAFSTHHSVWIPADVLELCAHFNWTVAEWRDVDDKTGIGFTIVIRK